MSPSHARPSRLRKWLFLFLILLAVVIGLLASAPVLISGPGRGLVLDRVNAALAGRVELDVLELGWGGPQRIRGLRLFDPAGNRVLEIGTIDIAGSLLDLVLSPHCRGEILVRDVDADIVIGADGGTNLGEVVGSAESDERAEPASFETLRGMDCRLRLAEAGFGLRASGMEPIRISQLNANLRLDGLEALTGRAEAALVQGESSGRIGLRVEAGGLFDARARLDPARAEFDFNLDMTDFPVDLADRLAGLGGRLRAVLGSTMDQKLEGQWHGTGGRLALVTDSSAGGRARLQFVVRDGTVSLEETAEVTFAIDPRAWSLLAPGGATLVGPFEVDARVEQLAFDPVNSIAAVDARLAIGDIELQADDARVGRVALRETRVAVNSDDLRDGLAIELETAAEQGGHSGQARFSGRLSDFLTAGLAPVPERLRVELDGEISELPLAVLDQIAGGGGLLPAALGARMNADLHFEGVPAQGGGEFNLIARSAHLRTGIAGTLDAKGLVLDTGRVGLDLQPALAARFTDALDLASPASVDLQVGDFRVPRRSDGLAWSDSRIELVAELANTRLRTGAGGGAIELAGRLQASSERLADGLALGFDGRVGDGSAGGPVRVEAGLDGSMALAGPVRVELPDFPVEAIDRLAGQDGRLGTLLGPSMTAGLEVAPAGDGSFSAEMKLDSERLHTRFNARYAGARLMVEPDARIDWELTPAALSALQAEPVWTLVRPAAVDIRVERLEAGFGAGDLEMGSLSVVAEAGIPELVVKRGDEAPLRIAGLSATVDGRPLAERLELRASGDLAGGAFHSETTITGLVNAAGELSVGDASLRTDTRLENVPGSLVLALAELDPALGPALGPSVRARVSGSVPGDLEVSAEGSNTRVSADANIDADGVLGLNRDAELALNITPPLIDGYLARLHPFLHDVRSAEQPIRLTLSGDGFRMPLTGYRPEAIRASGRLEIGTLNMNRGAITMGLFGALQQLGGNVRMGSTFQARFTPLEFSVRDGQVETNDLWMQMDNMMLGARGIVRLPEQVDGVPWADMVFAVPGQTLRGVPRIADSIAPDRILTTSSSGPLDKISPNFSELFAGLVTQSAIDRVAGKSEIGQAIGGLLGAARSAARDSSSSGDGNESRPQGQTRSRWPNMPPIETASGAEEPGSGPEP